MAAKKMKSMNKKGGGRPFGESTNSGRRLMMSETKPFGNNPSMRVAGRAARTNGVAQLKGRASQNWSNDPNITRKKN